MTRTRRTRKRAAVNPTELRCQLEDRKREILEQVRRKIRDVVPAHAAGLRDGARDLADRSEAQTQTDIDLVLLEMTARAVAHIDEALARVEQRRYGYCLDCGCAIPGPRLAVMPFAVRCTACARLMEASAPRPSLTRRASLWHDTGASQ